MIVPLFVQCDQPPFLALDCEQYEDGPTPSDMSVETSTAASLTAKVVGRIHLISRTVLNTRLPSEVRDFQAERFDQWVAFRMRSYTRVRISALAFSASCHLAILQSLIVQALHQLHKESNLHNFRQRQPSKLQRTVLLICSAGCRDLLKQFSTKIST